MIIINKEYYSLSYIYIIDGCMCGVLVILIKILKF